MEGAFAEEANANTTFVGVSSYGWLDNTWSYNAMASFGKTRMDVRGVGLLNDIQNIASSAFGFEAARQVGLIGTDSFHIGLSQPLHVESGEASVMIPKLYDVGGNLNFEKEIFDLEPSGRQIDVTLGYQTNLWNSLNLGIQTAFSDDFGHIKSDEYVSSLGAFLKLKL